MIVVDTLTKRFGRIQAVSELSFAVPAGTIVGFLGPNGAGKTTTLRALLGLLNPTAGGATIEGRRYRDLVEPVQTVGAALEGTAFHPGRSGRNHLRVLAAAAGLPRSRVEEVLELVELTPAAKRRVGGYSLGMRQRLALAAALLGDPRVLVLDEPANGLDPAGIRWLRDLLRARADAGGTVLISSHVLAEVAQTVDSVVVIARGRLVTQSSLPELTARAAPYVRVASPDVERLATALRERGAKIGGPSGERMNVAGLDAAAIGELASEHGVVLHELAPERTSLEDVFFQLTGGGQ